MMMHVGIAINIMQNDQKCAKYFGVSIGISLRKKNNNCLKTTSFSLIFSFNIFSIYRIIDKI